MQPKRRRIIAALAAAALTLGLAACGREDIDGTRGTAPNSTASAADVAFAQSMIPHHEQAIAMADMALDPASGASQEVQALATQITAAQDPEIEQMTMWLQQWGQPTAMPSTSPEHMGGQDHDMGGITMSGMMSSARMSQLDGMTGEAFDRMWLQVMTEHHEGAIDMAQQVAGATADPQVAAMAQDIITAQQAEIATMQAMLQ